MREHLTAVVVPTYILLCLLLGGSVQGIYFNLTLQLVGLGLIGWAWIKGKDTPLNRPAKTLFLLFALLVILTLVHVVPLPAGVWSSLPGREPIAQGFRLLGLPLPPMPLSLTPQETLGTLLTLIPPFAILSAIILLAPQRTTWIAAAILIGTTAGVLLGTLQVGSSNPQTSMWYLYRQSNFGNAVGFFANSNHMASLLVISVPILFGLVKNVQLRADNKRAKSGRWMLLVAGLLVLVVGVILNPSFAALLLLPPVFAVSTMLLLPKKHPLYRALPTVGGVLAIVLVAFFLSPFADRLGRNEGSSIDSRRAIWAESYSAATEYAPFGSGIGSYRWVVAAGEDPRSIDTTVTNHAHNDWLEIFVEAGVFGLALAGLFFAWWVRRAKFLWRSDEDPLVQAAVVVSGALLFHSLVDYPLRTSALSVIMAACLAMMVRPTSMRASATKDLWRTRHVKL